MSATSEFIDDRKHLKKKKKKKTLPLKQKHTCNNKVLYISRVI